MNYFQSLVIRKEHLYGAHLIEEKSIYIRRIHNEKISDDLGIIFSIFLGPLEDCWTLKIFIAAAHDLIFF